ncbi:hypothetical protein SANA_14860 [Gottschalkiaceae bacterium SANA]|nr:hypothetical protein SANA_14860 [Gottschalkiaceae bacterium SANA]
MFEYEITSGIPKTEIFSYFSEAALRCNKNEQVFYGDGWEVRLFAMPDAIHCSIIMPRTLIQFRGGKKECEALIHSYRRAFMRGGA